MQVSRIAIALVGLIGFATPCFAQSGSWDIGPSPSGLTINSYTYLGPNGQPVNVNLTATSPNTFVPTNSLYNNQGYPVYNNSYQNYTGPIDNALINNTGYAQNALTLQAEAAAIANTSNKTGQIDAPSNLTPQQLYAFDLAELQAMQNANGKNGGNFSMPTGMTTTSLTNPGLGNVAHNPFPGLGKAQTAVLSNGGSQTLNPTTRTVLSQFGYQGLPATSLDSFVSEAGGMAEMIYGDEGVWDIPPFFGMNESHTIGIGIASPQVDPGGLSTGHGVGLGIGPDAGFPGYLPSAWCTYE